MSRFTTKTYKMIYAPNKVSDQPGHLLSDQSSLSAWRKLGSLATHWGHTEDSDQTYKDCLLNLWLLFFLHRNIFDWWCYAFLLAVIVTHIVDIAAHTDGLARAHIRLTAVTVIFLWLRLMKNIRAFATLGEWRDSSIKILKVRTPKKIAIALRAVWSGPTLFDQIYLSENFRSVW